MKRIVIIGGGIMGLTVAYWIKRHYSHYHVRIFEKEPLLGEHASGRNSGVLHAGFYYSPDSLKATFCKEGQQFLIQYIKENDLSINPCGKLVVARDEDDIDQLKLLKQRGHVNGIDLEWCDEKRVAEIDPMVFTFKHALFSPTTATVDPHEILSTLHLQLSSEGVIFHFGESFSHYVKGRVVTDKDHYDCDFFINCAGTYAVDISRQFEVGLNYQVLPFKGLYLLSEKPLSLKTNVYPVPAKDVPFLGTHFTVTFDHKVKIGPTAIPVFSYEHYSGIENIRLRELFPILKYEMLMFLLNKSSFRRLAQQEGFKCFRSYLAKQACQLTRGIDPGLFTTWSKPGIRAQLLDKRTLQLVDDFVLERTSNSLHILNAVSPAFTSSFSLSRYIVECYMD